MCYSNTGIYAKHQYQIDENRSIKYWNINLKDNINKSQYQKGKISINPSTEGDTTGSSCAQKKMFVFCFHCTIIMHMDDQMLVFLQNISTKGEKSL